ncbi:hypothetical protein EV643_10527 [Kribbella sp. VKM Ac-2527]|uniref:DUF2071 domain-containing protein n=1 Tax=Kribbella caucasensis TaxID=2512215 RepID=A0A4R6KG19_9ACTN|nr:DUF2071 domain-containing protein [Kribbella sp. VKM Ac-2527]TDO49800.1 hypothetical protein EV643_10527 [Kribbella sp. VKM Ac-2527]
MREAVTPDAPYLPKPRILRQDWLNLSFLHWAVDPPSVVHFFPPGTEPDTFEGRTYVGLVPFQMANTGFPHGPALIGTFLETNVRLYSVDRTGRRGVVFLSLDTNRLDVVAAARTAFGLPYRWARMSYQQHNGLHTYESVLRWPGPAAASTVTVRPSTTLIPGPLEHFLTARWGLHVARAGRTWYLPNDHPTWVLRTAELVDFEDHGLLAPIGLGDRPPDHVAFSAGVAARFGLPVRAETPRRAVLR